MWNATRSLGIAMSVNLGSTRLILTKQEFLHPIADRSEQFLYAFCEFNSMSRTHNLHITPFLVSFRAAHDDLAPTMPSMQSKFQQSDGRLCSAGEVNGND